MENKTLLVLGASSDVGCELIRAAADRYGTILAHYFHMNENLSALQSDLGEKLILLRADLSRRGETEAMTAQVRERGCLPEHIVHLAAPVCRNERFARCDVDGDFGYGIGTSVMSAVSILQAFLPAMAKKKYGRVVFMLTAYVEGKPPKYLSPYITAKYALLGLMKSLAAEYAEKGITVNGVSPEMMETRFLREIPELVVAQSAAASPLKRNLTTADVVPAFLYLLSEEAGCVTGQNLMITGGK